MIDIVLFLVGIAVTETQNDGSGAPECLGDDCGHPGGN